MKETVQESHYDADMAAILKLGDWIDHLKGAGVYDNTRIIITSDHGYGLKQFSYTLFNDIGLDVSSVNPLLIIKDFDGGNEDIRTDNTFMTNADVPVIAMEGIVKDPVNPFTGNPVNNERKEEGPVVVFTLNSDVDPEKDKVYDREDAVWYSVHDDMFNPADWERLEKGE